MKNNKRAIVLNLLVIAALVLSFTVTAQELNAPNRDTVEEEDLEMFAVALAEVNMIQDEGGAVINTTIEDSELPTERFFEIYGIVQNNPESIETIPEDEQDTFTDVMEEISTIQQQMQEMMVSAVQTAGLTVDEFNSIFQIMQEDPELQQKVQELISAEESPSNES